MKVDSLPLNTSILKVKTRVGDSGTNFEASSRGSIECG